MNFFKDIYRFIGYLTLVDVVFFTAIIVLLILIVTLIYFIRINKEVLKKDSPSSKTGNSNNKPQNDKSSDIMNLSNLELDKPDDEEGELLDLEALTKKLEQEKESNRINFTEYEKDQEEKAIISYDELVKKHNNYAINYEKEEVLDDLVIKKVNLNDLLSKDKSDEIHEVRVISYDKEEAFLSALKELNRLLN